MGGLRKKFGHLAAVQDVSFTVAYGRVTGFLGPNGAGKTTTLRMLLGLIRPDAGTATIAGTPNPDLASPAQTVGALLDAAAHPGRSGQDHLRVLAAAAGIPGERAGQPLATVGLQHAARQRADVTPSACGSGSAWPPPCSATRPCWSRRARQWPGPARHPLAA